MTVHSGGRGRGHSSRLQTLGVSGPAPEIWLGWGDSLGVGVYARAGGTDLDWPGVYQVRDRAPAGISADISPLDQAIAPDGTDYLSPYEYFAKQRAADIGADVYLVPHNWNGTSFVPTNWGVGETMHEAFISRANAAIQTVRAAAPTAVVGGIIQFEGTNDASAGTTPSTYQTALTAAIADMRARIFRNGVSGTDVSALPYIISGIIPEFLSTSDRITYSTALKRVALATTNGKYYNMPSGITSENVHPNLAGNRTIGPAIAGLLTDVVGPTMTSAATFSNSQGSTLAFSLTSSDAYATFHINGGAGAANFEVSDPVLNPALQWTGGGTGPAVGDYVVGVRARDGAGNYGATQSVTITVTAAFSPADILTGGRVGVWYDPSDLTTLFKDVAGTTPVTTHGDPVGKMLDKSGQGKHLVASADDASRPTYKVSGAVKYLEFNGSQFMTRASPFGTMAEATVIFAGRVVTAQNSCLFTFGGTNIWTVYSWGDYTGYFDVGGYAAPNRVTGPMGYVAGADFVNSYDDSVANSRQFIHSDKVVIASDASGESVSPASDMFLGALAAAGPTNAFIGNFHGMIATVGVAMTPTELGNSETWLANKQGRVL